MLFHGTARGCGDGKGLAANGGLWGSKGVASEVSGHLGWGSRRLRGNGFVVSLVPKCEGAKSRDMGNPAPDHLRVGGFPPFRKVREMDGARGNRRMIRQGKVQLQTQ